jgi:hypothetical protein
VDSTIYYIFENYSKLWYREREREREWRKDLERIPTRKLQIFH